MRHLEIKKDIFWVGALDPNLRIFDIIMHTPYGTSYNSYVVKGKDKTVIFETVKEQFFNEYIERLKDLNINFEEINYIVLDHTEPDHAGSVAKMLELAPNASVVGTSSAINFLKEITNNSFKSIVAKHNMTLDLGGKTIRFISVPFLHWPDSMYTYVEEDHVLISCDSFGAHYCEENVFNDLVKSKEDYMDALSYYFKGIFGPFKKYVLEAVDKIKDLKIDVICPGHGPILRDKPEEIIEIYKKWATVPKKDESVKTVVIPFVSAYGYTEELANKISEGINSVGKFNIVKYNVIYSDKEEILNCINSADGVLFGSPTINGDALEPILDLLINLNPIVNSNLTAAAFGSYGWSGEAVKNIEERLNQLRLKVVGGFKVRFKPSEAQNQEAFEFGRKFASSILGIDLTKCSSDEGKWKCIVCGYIHDGDNPPEICPLCKVPKEKFELLVEEKSKV